MASARVHLAFLKEEINMKINGFRRFALLLACLIFTGMLPLTALAADRFTVSLHASEKKISVGDSVEIAVVVGHDGSASKYNSFDMTFSYDPKMLEVTSTTISGMSVTVGNGEIRVLRYGTDLNVDTAAFTLSFQAIKNGTTAVKAASAKIGIQETAQDEDAEKAKILKDASFSVSTKAKASGDSSNPRTADDSKVVIWNGIMLTSLLGLVVLILKKERVFMHD
jgi:hypothetical protein